eukprot:TRINITY_DN7575_c0_g1_i1.p1 TRINITY_DN7575_c0_g1~~TRINITY_DN7575_c0_g1_i1.p1  ORF type:complete len:1133 (+),score=234.87 TRINITY_DN7575_c0_g1_i1:48-3446(+)
MKSSSSTDDLDELEGSNFSNVRVFLRARPFLPRERDPHIASGVPLRSIIQMTDTNCSILDPANGYSVKDTFVFDQCFWSLEGSGSQQHMSQADVYAYVGPQMLDNIFAGYNACLFAYGQTGSGKTWTMMGDLQSNTNKGIIPRLCEELFHRIHSCQLENQNVSFKVEASYMEIYNEKVRDLLTEGSAGSFEDQRTLRVRQHPVTGPFVDGLSSFAVTDFPAIRHLMEQGGLHRVTASTRMNDRSSRSHAIFTLTFSQLIILGASDGGDGVQTKSRISKIHLVDLAGSERVAMSGVEGLQFKEATMINLSLSTLGRVIDALVETSLGRRRKDKSKILPPYRDSLLTWILSESLGGNSKTFMIANVSPAPVNFDETLSTLRYSSRARDIINIAVVNEDSTVKIIAQLRNKVEKLSAQVRRLQAKEQEYERTIEELRNGTGGGSATPGVRTKTSETEELSRLRQQLARVEEEKSAQIDSLRRELLDAKRQRNESDQLGGLCSALRAAGVMPETTRPGARVGSQPSAVVLEAGVRELTEAKRKADLRNAELQAELERLRRTTPSSRSEPTVDVEEVQTLRRVRENLQARLRDAQAVEEGLREEVARLSRQTSELSQKLRDSYRVGEAADHRQRAAEAAAEQHAQRVQELQEEVGAQRTKLQNLLRENREMRQELTELKVELQKTLAAKQRHDEERNQVVQQVHDQRVARENAEKRLADTIAAQKELQREFDSLHARLAASKSERQVELARFENERAELRSLVEQKDKDLEAKRAAMSAEVRDLRRAIAESNDVRQEAEAALKREQAEARRTGADFERVTKEHAELQRQVLELKTALKAAQLSEQRLRQVLDGQKESEQAQVAKLTQLEESFAQQRNEVEAQWRRRVEQLQARLQAAVSEVAERKKDSQDASELRQEVQQLRANLREATERFEAVQSKAQRQSEQLSSANTNWQRSEGELKRRVSELEDRLAEAKDRLADRTQQLKSLQAEREELDQLRHRERGLQGQAEDLQQTLQNRTQLLKEQHQELARLREQCQSLQAAEGNAVRDRDELESELQEAKRTNQAMEREISKSRQQLQDMRQEMTALRQEVQQGNDNASDRERAVQKIHELREQVAALREQVQLAKQVRGFIVSR